MNSSVRHAAKNARSQERLTVGYISTYLPRKCGLATFTGDLVSAMSKLDGLGEPHVVAIAGRGQNPCDYLVPTGCTGRDDSYTNPVKLVINQDSYGDHLRAATFFNESPVDVVSVQHEFGIYGGHCGRYVIDFIEALKKPFVVTLHTVMPRPHPKYAGIIRRMASVAGAIVIMNPLAAEILERDYSVETTNKVRFIHHGVPDSGGLQPHEAKKLLGLEGRFVISTFGLISRGKGLEYAIKAVARAKKDIPNLTYLILGRTHPNIVMAEGESYRAKLLALVRELGVDGQVIFVDRFLDQQELICYLLASDIYMTPYLNPDQVVSGTLAYAVGLGRPVISTPYLYARAMAEEGVAVTVPFRDSEKLADAIVRLALDDDMRVGMVHRALQLGKAMTWENVARSYMRLFKEVKEGQVEAADEYRGTGKRGEADKLVAS
ncbi:MAG TPA: glycosyltransferase [Firmicutes bacterium]|nr:glycosyltransferase [Candidatus Fermentithermobacillaceae bacterium]